MRHELIKRGAMVDLQKGERYVTFWTAEFRSPIASASHMGTMRWRLRLRAARICRLQ